MTRNNPVTICATRKIPRIDFMDNTKTIICPLLAAVTYIDENKKFCTFWFSFIAENGCYEHLTSCLKYALEKINLIL